MGHIHPKESPPSLGLSNRGVTDQAAAAHRYPPGLERAYRRGVNILLCSGFFRSPEWQDFEDFYFSEVSAARAVISEL